MRRGAPCPRSVAGRAAPGAGVTLGAGPAYPVLGPGGAASLRDDLRVGGWYLHKTMWAVRPSYPGPVLARGRQIDGESRLRFDRRRLQDLRLPDAAAAEGGWRYYPTYTAVRRPGCFAFQIDGHGFSRGVVFAARH
jgi:hypothetical protein